MSDTILDGAGSWRQKQRQDPFIPEVGTCTGITYFSFQYSRLIGSDQQRETRKRNLLPCIIITASIGIVVVEHVTIILIITALLLRHRFSSKLSHFFKHKYYRSLHQQNPQTGGPMININCIVVPGIPYGIQFWMSECFQHHLFSKWHCSSQNCKTKVLISQLKHIRKLWDTLYELYRLTSPTFLLLCIQNSSTS